MGLVTIVCSFATIFLMVRDMMTNRKRHANYMVAGGKRSQ
jgi:hypothetical protein